MIHVPDIVIGEDHKLVVHFGTDIPGDISSL